MLSVSADTTTATSASKRDLIYGFLISWLKTIPASVNFFTIGQSRIGGPDKIKSASSAAIAFFDKYQYTDESDYIKSFAISKKLSQYPWGIIMAQADIELNNTSRRFMPNFDPTIGAYVDLPDRPIKLSVGFGNETIPQFVGFSDQPESTLISRQASIHAFDAVDYLNKYVITGLGTLVNYRTDQIIAAILVEAGFSASQYSLEVGLQKPIGYIALRDKKAGDVIRDLVAAEMGLFFVDELGIIRFWNRQHLNNSSTPVWTFNYSNMRNVEWIKTPIINDVQVVAKPRVVAASQKIWENAQAVKIEAGQTLDVFADFRDDDGSLPVNAVDTPAYIDSATTSYYTTNLNEDGTGDNQNSSITLVSTALLGDSYRMTFSNNYTQAIYLTKIALFGTPAKVTHFDTKPQVDSASITAYGRNPANQGDRITITNDYIQDASTANSLAYTLVAEYKNPRKRLKCTVFAVPQLQIGDFITVALADTGQSINMFVMAKTLKLEGRANLVMDLELEQRTIKRYFTINQSKIGGTDSIAP